MELATFGQRLKSVFNNARNAEIARQIGVSESAVTNYMNGRVPDIEKLLLIKSLTKCDLDWLLSGDPSRIVDQPKLSKHLYELIRTIAKEQSNVVFSDAQIGGNLEGRTADLLVEYLLCNALKGFNLLDRETDLMPVADFKRAQKFSFVANAPQSLDDRIRELVSQTKGPLIGFDKEEFRDMIRDILNEESGTSRKALVMPIEIRNPTKKTRKAG